jgi:hydroxyacylglutathione hydrolase
MKIHQIFTNNVLRNYTYYIEFDNSDVIIIDPWDAKEAKKFIESKQLTLTTIINTHEHWDHTQGNQELVDKYGCEVWAHKVGQGKIPAQSRLLEPGESIRFDKETTMQVINTPGHCQAHLCFIIEHNSEPYCIFTGDILFNAGVGNCHNGGDVEDLYETICTKISTLPDSIIIYPGHDYLENNIRFTLKHEPSNTQAKLWLEKYQQVDINDHPLTTTLADEKQINTFLRLDNKEIQGNLNTTSVSEKETFIALRALRDKW